MFEGSEVSFFLVDVLVFVFEILCTFWRLFSFSFRCCPGWTIGSRIFSVVSGWTSKGLKPCTSLRVRIIISVYCLNIFRTSSLTGKIGTNESKYSHTVHTNRHRDIHTHTHWYKIVWEIPLLLVLYTLVRYWILVLRSME